MKFTTHPKKYRYIFTMKEHWKGISFFAEDENNKNTLYDISIIQVNRQKKSGKVKCRNLGTVVKVYNRNQRELMDYVDEEDNLDLYSKAKHTMRKFNYEHKRKASSKALSFLVEESRRRKRREESYNKGAAMRKAGYSQLKVAWASPGRGVLHHIEKRMLYKVLKG